MADDEHTMFLAELDEGVPRSEVVDARLGIHHLGFEHVLGGDRVELANRDLLQLRRLAGDDRFIDRGAHEKGAFIGCLECLRALGKSQWHERQGSV